MLYERVHMSSDSQGPTILKFFSSFTEAQNQPNIMEPENLDIESIMGRPAGSDRATVQELGVEELKSIGEKFFPFQDHPWRQHILPRHDS